MTSYQKVYDMLDAVEKDDGFFDFSSCQNCVVGRAVVLGTFGSLDIYHVILPEEGVVKGADILGISGDQLRAIWCGHHNISSVHHHNKDFCLNYCRELVAKWEAEDALNEASYLTEPLYVD